MTLTHGLALAAMFAGAAAFAQTGTPAPPDTSARAANDSAHARGTTSSMPASERAGTPSATEAGRGAANMSPSAVLSMLHQVNQDEMRLAKVAQSKAQSDKVKDYAKDMIDDHTALDKKLTDFVQKDGKGKVTLSPSQIPAEKRHQLKTMVDEAEKRLNTASAGPGFDQNYMSSMVRSHEAVLANLEAALPSLQGQDKIKDLVSSARDKVKEHRDHAMDVVKDLNRSTGTGGSGSNGSSTGASGTGTDSTGSSGASTTESSSGAGSGTSGGGSTSPSGGGPGR